MNIVQFDDCMYHRDSVGSSAINSITNHHSFDNSAIPTTAATTHIASKFNHSSEYWD